MKKSSLFSTVALLLLVQIAEAKIWRVNNNTGVTADFTSLTDAVNSASVLAGDTIHLESSTNGYGGANVNRKLVILGTGYFLTETAPQVANPKTEANTAVSTTSSIYFLPGSKGSVISGVRIASYTIIEDSLITVQRCYTDDIYLDDNYGAHNCFSDTIRQNVVGGRLIAAYGSTGKIKNLLVYNNLLFSSNPIEFGYNINNINGFVLNNDFLYGYSQYNGNNINITSANMVYQNNISGYINFGAYQSSNVYFNNICMGTGIPSGNSNVQNVDVPNVVFKDWVGNGSGYSSDSRYQLKSGSNPAVGGGTINGGTIDCGAFGGPAPYVLSGMPNMPSVYALTVPTQINAGTNTMNISLSSASH